MVPKSMRLLHKVPRGRAGETVGGLRALVALREDPGSVSGTYNGGSQPNATLVPGAPTVSSGLLRQAHTHTHKKAKRS